MNANPLAEIPREEHETGEDDAWRFDFADDGSSSENEEDVTNDRRSNNVAQHQQAMRRLPSDMASFSSIPNSNNNNTLDGMPPQLHPAVSLGVRRVSSCYFSLGSATSRDDEESIADLLLSSQFGDENNDPTTSSQEAWLNVSSISPPMNDTLDTILHHDIWMHVLEYLDVSSLASFSETARRANFEVFYFLQLQLEQALLVAIPSSSQYENQNGVQAETVWKNSSNNNIQNHVSSFAACGCESVTRLASLDCDIAKQVVEEYHNSNSTLRTMPISYSLAYARQYLLHKYYGFDKMMNDKDHHNRNAALAGAALFMTFVGAASIVGADAAATTFADNPELPNVLCVGFVTSLMGAAARQMSDTKQQQNSGEEDEEETTDSKPSSQFRLPSLYEMRQRLQNTLGKLAAKEQEQRYPMSLLPNPYDHLPSVSVEEEKKDSTTTDDMDTCTNTKTVSTTESPTADSNHCKKMSSGCVGAYIRAIHRASNEVMKFVKKRRKARFDALPEQGKTQLSLEFLAACSSNLTLDRVKEITPFVDVDGYFLEDGTETETCALHRAAFSGAHEVIEFLCTGIDEHGDKDGGLCNVNCQDDNGWTALHFAAGSNSVDAVRVLARFGANLQLEAVNGYSPHAWAVRLSNEEVANELMELMQNKKTGTNQGTWIMSSQPLTSIANRFFSLMPTTNT